MNFVDFYHFKADFRASGQLNDKKYFQNRIQNTQIGVYTYFCQKYQNICAGHKIGRADFSPFFDCDFETLAIEISKIQFYIRIHPIRIKFTPNF